VKRVVLTYRYRIKDETTAKRLRAHARAVNYVWNYCCEIQEAARRQEKRWPSAFDLMKLTTGSSALLGLHSKTVQAVCKQFVANRNAARRRPHWRGKKSLGWIPFAAARAVKLDGDAVIYLKRRYRLWRSRPVDGRSRPDALRRTRAGAGISASKSRLLRARPAVPAKLASISA
jgi:putative transposase